MTPKEFKAYYDGAMSVDPNAPMQSVAPLDLPAPAAALPPPAPSPAPASIPARALAAARAREGAAIPPGFAPDAVGFMGLDVDQRLAEQEAARASALQAEGFPSEQARQATYDMKRGLAEASRATTQAIGGEPMAMPEPLAPLPGISSTEAAAVRKQQEDFARRRPDLAFLGEAAKAKMGMAQVTSDIEKRRLEAQQEAEQRIGQTNLALEQQAAQDIKAQQERMLRFRQASEQAESDIAKLNKEVTDTKINPDAYYQNQNTFQKILSAIAIGLGGFVQGYSGGRIPNTALQIINSAIERDIEAQKANLANKRAAIGERRNLLAMARERFADEKQAEDWVRATLQQQVAAQARRFGAEAKTKEIGFAAEKIAAGYDQQAQELNLGVKQAYVEAEMARRAEEQQRAARAAAYAAGAPEREMKMRERILEFEAKKAGIAKTQAETARAQAEATGERGMASRTVMLGPNSDQQFVAPTDKSAEELRERQAAASAFASTVSKMQSVVDSKELGITDKNRLLDALHADAAAQLARSQAGGKTTETDEKRAKDILPKPARLFDTGEQAALNGLVGQAFQTVESYRSAIGASPVSGQSPPALLDVRKEE